LRATVVAADGRRTTAPEAAAEVDLVAIFVFLGGREKGERRAKNVF
jgi:hypothetical protein